MTLTGSQVSSVWMPLVGLIGACLGFILHGFVLMRSGTKISGRWKGPRGSGFMIDERGGARIRTTESNGWEPAEWEG